MFDVVSGLQLCCACVQHCISEDWAVSGCTPLQQHCISRGTASTCDVAYHFVEQQLSTASDLAVRGILLKAWSGGG
jgi:hypothetical protein